MAEGAGTSTAAVYELFGDKSGLNRSRAPDTVAKSPVWLGKRLGEARGLKFQM